MEKEIKQIKKYLLHSKLAVFAIIGFLIVLTYLLIFVSKQISNSEISYIYRPIAQLRPTSPPTNNITEANLIIPFPGENSTPATPLTCNDYNMVIDNMHLELKKLQLECPRCPLSTKAPLKPEILSEQQEQQNQPNVIIPTDPCSRYIYLHTYLNGLKELIAQMCLRCPEPTNSLIPGKPWITAQPIPTGGTPIPTIY